MTDRQRFESLYADVIVSILRDAIDNDPVCRPSAEIFENLREKAKKQTRILSDESIARLLGAGEEPLRRSLREVIESGFRQRVAERMPS